MKLVGRKITREVSKEPTSPALFVFPKRNAMRFTSGALIGINLEEKLIGIGYPEEEDEHSHPLLYIVDDENGFKVNKSGTVNAKYHANALTSLYAAGQEDGKLVFDVEVEPTTFDDPDLAGIKFYALKFKEYIPEKEKDAEQVPEVPMEVIEEAENKTLGAEEYPDIDLDGEEEEKESSVSPGFIS